MTRKQVLDGILAGTVNHNLETLHAAAGYLSKAEVGALLDRVLGGETGVYLIAPGCNVQRTVVLLPIHLRDGVPTLPTAYSYTAGISWVDWSDEYERADSWSKANEEDYDSRLVGVVDKVKPRWSLHAPIFLQDPGRHIVRTFVDGVCHTEEVTYAHPQRYESPSRMPTTLGSLVEFYREGCTDSDTQMHSMWRARQHFRDMIVPGSDKLKVAEMQGVTHQGSGFYHYYCSRCGHVLCLTGCSSCRLYFHDDQIRTGGGAPLDEDAQHLFETAYGHTFKSDPKRWRDEQDAEYNPEDIAGKIAAFEAK